MRTPKHGVVRRFEGWTAKKYRATKTLIPFVEVLFAVYFAVATVIAVQAGHYVSLPFMLLFTWASATSASCRLPSRPR